MPKKSLKKTPLGFKSPNGAFFDPSVLERVKLGIEWFGSLSKKINGKHIAHCLFNGRTSAVTDESLQRLSPGRGPQVSDGLLDFSGACIGILVMDTVLFLRMWEINNRI